MSHSLTRRQRRPSRDLQPLNLNFYHNGAAAFNAAFMFSTEKTPFIHAYVRVPKKKNRLVRRPPTASAW